MRVYILINEKCFVFRKKFNYCLIYFRSQTGSGKTLSYSLPIVESLHSIRPKVTRNQGVLALIIVPTRELAIQTYELFVKLVKVRNFYL